MKPSPADMLFAPDELDPWRAEWQDMPEFDMRDLTSWKQLIVHFATPGDLAAFAKLIEQTITPRTKSLWFPPAEIGSFINKRYVSIFATNTATATNATANDA